MYKIQKEKYRGRWYYCLYYRRYKLFPWSSLTSSNSLLDTEEKLKELLSGVVGVNYYDENGVLIKGNIK